MQGLSLCLVQLSAYADVMLCPSLLEHARSQGVGHVVTTVFMGDESFQLLKPSSNANPKVFFIWKCLLVS